MDLDMFPLVVMIPFYAVSRGRRIFGDPFLPLETLQG